MYKIGGQSLNCEWCLLNTAGKQVGVSASRSIIRTDTV